VRSRLNNLPDPTPPPLGWVKERGFDEVFPFIRLPELRPALNGDWVQFGTPELEPNRLYFGDNLQVLRAYEHKNGWVNRCILGDSLVVMNSLLNYEGLGGQVQCIYMDPPYGVNFGSNFQPFVRKPDVKHNEDEDMTRESALARNRPKLITRCAKEES